MVYNNKMKKKILAKYLFFLCLFINTSFIISAVVEFPLIQSVSYFPYSDHSVLDKGEISSTLDLNHSNIYMFNEERSTINDFESLGTTISFRYGIWQNTTLEIYLRHTAIFGGFLDKFIEDFHSTFNMPDNRRPEYPRFAVHYKYNDSFFYKGNENAFSPLVVGLIRQFYQTGQFSLKGRLSLGLPLSKKPGFSSDKAFLTGGVIMSFRTGKFSLELANHLSFYKRPSWLGDTDIHSVLFHSGIETRLWRFIGGFTFRSSLFKAGDLANNAYQCYFGYKFTKFLEFIILEDFFPFDTTPDISFGLRVKFL